LLRFSGTKSQYHWSSWKFVLLPDSKCWSYGDFNQIFRILQFSGTKTQSQQSWWINSNCWDFLVPKVNITGLPESLSYCLTVNVDLMEISIKYSESFNFLVPKLDLSNSDELIQIAQIFWSQKSISLVFLKVCLISW
jgi:hypothetical protein